MTYKIKPEYRKMLEIYPSYEEEVKYLVEEEGFIRVHNIVTGQNDNLWTSLSMFNVNYKYKAKDKLISLLCSDEEFNNAFQRACESQWNNESCFVRITYPLSDLDKEMDDASKIHIYKGDIERIAV